MKLLRTLVIFSGFVLASYANAGCRTVVGVDMSSSVPWNTKSDELNYVLDQVVDDMAQVMSKGDEILIKPFGSFLDRVEVNRALATHLVRRGKISKEAIKGKIAAVINATKKDQEQTSILAFLHQLPSSRSLQNCRVYIVTDGMEFGEFGPTQDFAKGKALPQPFEVRNYLENIEIMFIGFGRTGERVSSDTISRMKSAWRKHCEAAGAKLCEFPSG